MVEMRQVYMLENILNSENPPVENPARESYRDSLLQFHSLLEKPRSLKGDYPGLAFDRLPADAKAPIAQALAEWVEFFQMHSSGERISDKQFLWRFLSAFRLKTHPDFFASVDDETSFEVVNTEGHQTFRSISLMDCCSYSLDELVSIPWYELFSRDQSITDKYLQFQEATTNGTLVHTNLEGIIPVHQVSENFGFDKMVLTMKPLYLSPIYDMDDKVVGVISAIKVLNYVSRREETQERVRAELAAVT
jgi:hypothetical protein